MNTTANITIQITTDEKIDVTNTPVICSVETPDADITTTSITTTATISSTTTTTNGTSLGAHSDSETIVSAAPTHRKSKSLRRHRGLRHINGTHSHSHSNGVGREEDEFNSKLKQFQQIINFNKRSFDPTAIEVEQVNEQEQPSDSKRRKYTIGNDRSPLWTTLTHAQTISEYPES